MTALLMATAALSAHAQGSDKETVSRPQFSGYVMGQYQATVKEGDNANTFNIRMARLSVTGRIMGEFEYKLQGQVNGNTATLGSSPRIVDAFVEWQRYGAMKVKVGQFKRPFTFENPMHPIDQGFMGYSQNVSRLAGFDDRAGEQASNGRDIGVQLQGDLFPAADGHAWLHYQVGVFNGQGINTKDVDNRKDVIGGLWVSPVKGLRIGAFGWSGSKARSVKTVDNAGIQHTSVTSLGQYRYALSAEYKRDGWQLRSEYIHSTGYAFESAQSAVVNESLGNKADGVYALCIAPVIPGKLHAKARYDLYRPTATWSDCRTQYEAGLNWLIHKNVEVHTEYALVNDRSLSKHNYSMVDVEMCVRF